MIIILYRNGCPYCERFEKYIAPVIEKEAKRKGEKVWVRVREHLNEFPKFKTACVVDPDGKISKWDGDLSPVPFVATLRGGTLCIFRLSTEEVSKDPSSFAQRLCNCTCECHDCKT